ncbi:MAG TPA: hypothetical protein PLW86_00585 [Rhodocyclaceae bacterium]|nr:hypothetical protein [Rhodocyclaceae bacterium]
MLEPTRPSRHLVRRTFACITLVLMAGCATEYGKKVSANDVAFVQKGRTTRAELIQRLGQPTNTIRESTGREQLVWEYMKTTNDAKSMIPFTFVESQQYETSTFTAVVDTKGKVVDYSVASGRSSSSNTR